MLFILYTYYYIYYIVIFLLFYNINANVFTTIIRCISALYLLFPLRYTSSTDISAGDTPEMRDACPIDTGLYSFSF